LQAHGSASRLTAKPIAHAPDGFDDPGIQRIDLNPLSQLGDVLIEGARLREIIDSPASIQEQIAINDLAGMCVQ
jgi:hypothetical protein